MNNFFNINIAFNHDAVESVIQEHVSRKKKGFVCVVDGNIVSVAHRDPHYRNVVNCSIVNLCDGSYLALLYNLLKKKSVKPYIGGDLFLKMIGSKQYRHLFLGSTSVVLDALEIRLQRIDTNIESANFMPLPFLPAAEFDYPGIASVINRQGPDFIWVSLGAPKQEIFMHRLLPYLDKGVMVGIGAVFNFQSGIKSLRRAPDIIVKLKLEWLYRLFQEPKKQWRKNQSFLRVLPMLLIAEMKKK